MWSVAAAIPVQLLRKVVEIGLCMFNVRLIHAGCCRHETFNKCSHFNARFDLRLKTLADRIWQISADFYRALRSAHCICRAVQTASVTLRKSLRVHGVLNWGGKN